MKKINKSICSLILAMLLIFGNGFCFVSNAETDFTPFLKMWGVEGKAVVEYIDDVRYVYFIENGEATILNILTGFYVSGEKTLALPETLGGYPVTSLGYCSQENNFNVEVFVYIFNNGDDFKDDFPDYDYAPEYDGAVCGVTRDEAITLIIPEGYEHIEKNALNGFSGYIDFPKSLKTFYNEADMVECFYGRESFAGKSTFVFPECKYNSSFSFDFVNDSYIFPSRDTSCFISMAYSGHILGNLTKPNAMYVPFNISIQDILNGLYDNGTNTPSYRYDGATIYCPPDSEFISVIEEMGGYTVNTNVPVAEYIEFPDKSVNIHVGDVVDLEAKTYPAEAIWTACDYTVSDPSVVKIDEYSGRITALKEGTVTVTATHCERGFVDTCTVNVVPEPVPGVNEIKPATDTPYYSYGNRDYTLDVTGSPSKIQVVRDNGGTTTIDRRRAKVTSNGETETWVVNMRVEAGTHNIRAKYGNKWDERLTPFTVTYDTPPTPKAYSFDLGYENGLGTFEVVTDPQIIKVQFVLDNGCTLTYSQGNSYVAEDGLRHWVITRKIPANTNYTLKTKLGYTWTTTNLKVTS